MIRSMFAGVALVSLAAAAPAAAATTLNFNFGGPAGTTNVASTTRTVVGKTLTATARRFTVAPSSLTNLSQTTGGAMIQQTAPGIGVNGGGSSPQVDTNQPKSREGILFTSNIANFSLHGAKLSFIDANDTFQVYGVNADNSFTSLGFPGALKSALGGATVVNTAANSGTSVVTLTNPTAYFSRYFFTTRVGGEQNFMGMTGQGYRIDSISGAVPEPATWVMLIVGFGLVGLAARRRNNIVTA